MQPDRSCHSIKQYFIRQSGFTLVELLVSITLIALLLSGTLSLLATSVTAWQAGSSQTDVQQTARFAVDSLVRDIQYAHKISITGTTQLDLWTDKYGTVNQQITYLLDTAGATAILRRNNQPMTGQSSNTTISISDFNLTALVSSQSAQPRIVGIIITAIDNISGQQYTIRTAATAMMVTP